MTTLAALLGALLVKPGLILGAAAAIAAGLRHRTAATRHAVWAGAILATLALPLLRRMLPPLRIPAPFTAIEGSPPTAAWLGTPGTSADKALPPVARGFPGGVASDGVGGRRVGLENRLARGMIALWMLGVLLLVARRVIAEVRVHRILRRAWSASDPRLERRFADIARSSGIRRPVELRVSDEVGSPVVAGLFRSTILLPTGASTWAESELSPILIHELGHVARRDCLLNLVAALATAVYWMNPVVRMAVRRMRAESESACDDLVLRQGTEPEGYAQLLLRLARTARMAGGLPSAAVAVARPRELESRLLAVLDPRVRRNPLSRWMSPALTGLGILFAVPTAALTLHAAPPQAPAPKAAEPDRRADSLAGPASERLPFTPDLGQLSLRAAQALAGPDSSLAAPLVAALGHQSSGEEDLVRERAAWAISQVNHSRLVEPLLGALDARDWRVQAYAAWALAPARDPRATDRLIPLLAHPVWRLRAMAAYAVRESGNPAAEAAMTAALTDPAWQVRVEAVEYLAALGGPALSQRLRPRLGDRHVAVRLAAEAALTSR